MDKIQKLQNEIGKISKDKTNPFFKSQYFDINSLLEHLKPLLEKYDLTVIQPLSSVDGRPALRTIVFEGEKSLLNEAIVMPDLQDPQKMGSAITYYRRYALQSLFLLQAEDDDANLASKGSKEPIYVDIPGAPQKPLKTQNTAPQGIDKICIACEEPHNGPYPKCYDCWKGENNKK